MRSIYHVTAVFFVLALAQPAFVSAHAQLVQSVPANGAVLTVIPSKVVAVYNEELKTSGSFITVTDAAGTQVDAGDGRVDLNDVDHKTIAATLQPGLGAGTYTMHWQAITADDNGATQGNITFTVTGTAPASAISSNTAATSSASHLPNTGSEGYNSGWLLGLALLCGLFGLTLRRSAYRS